MQTDERYTPRRTSADVRIDVRLRGHYHRFRSCPQQVQCRFGFGVRMQRQDTAHQAVHIPI